MICFSFGKRARSQKGVALLVTLALIAVLSAAAFELGRRVRNSSDSAVQEKNRFMAEQMAISGVNLAMYLLDRDVNDKSRSGDSLQEEWADPGKISRAVDSLGFEKGTLDLDISDELGKIQINALLKEFPGSTFNHDQRALWERLLALLVSGDRSLDQRSPVEIINSVKDWLDSGDDGAVTGISGAESPYYQELDPPYDCANAPMNLVDELFRVKGISKALLKSKSSLLLEKNGFDQTGEGLPPPALSDIFTVYGMAEKKAGKGGFCFPGKININTADVMVLAALLPPGMEDQAAELAEFRTQRGEDEQEFVNSLDKGWYEQVIDLSAKEKKRFDRTIRYSTRFFAAECTASVDNTTVSLKAVIQRKKSEKTNKGICTIIKLSGM
ncbi:MAG: type II secretion system protein GspK [Desulfobacteraceae bacterium]